MNRREFIQLTSRGLAGSLLGVTTYSMVEAKCIQTSRFSMNVPNLPRSFHGLTVAFLADFHHSAVVPKLYLEHVVNVTNALGADLIVLGGDYVTDEPRYRWLNGETYIEPCFEILKQLRSKLGVFAVTGNHDSSGLDRINAAMAAAGIQSLDNTGVWLNRGEDRLRLCGVMDLRTRHPEVNKALGGANAHDAVILVSHHPDVAEIKLHDSRVGLMLSGHTHGGQVVLPFFGAPAVAFASDYGQKYRSGIVQGPHCKVFVTRGVGTLPPAYRVNCPPEVAFITLTSSLS